MYKEKKSKKTEEELDVQGEESDVQREEELGVQGEEE